MKNLKWHLICMTLIKTVFKITLILSYMKSEIYFNFSIGKVDKKEMEQIIVAIYDLLGEENRKGDNAPAERVKKIMLKLGN